MGLILDSSVVIDAERRGDTVVQMLRHLAAIAGDQRAALSAIGLTELVHAVHRAPELSIRLRRERFIEELVEDLEVVPYTKKTAMLAGRVDGEQRLKGINIPSVDLFIGATALEHNYALVTSNVRHFRLIPGLQVIQV
jgi:predicted nucleic acid-binding protein